MHKSWMRRRLPAAVFAVFVILYVDFQLRTGTDAPARRRAAAPRSGGHARGAAGSVSSSRLELQQVFIAVKTTGRFHGTRLALLLRTWISRTRAQTFIFTDMEDENLRAEGVNVVVTGCHSDHSQQALSCKMSAEYDAFMASGKRFLNAEALLALLSGFPQDGDVYVGKPSLDRPIRAHELTEGNTTVPAPVPTPPVQTPPMTRFLASNPVPVSGTGLETSYQASVLLLSHLFVFAVTSVFRSHPFTQNSHLFGLIISTHG